MRITPLGDSALLVQLGEHINESTHARVQAAWQALEANPLPSVWEIVGAYTTLTLFYQPAQAVAAGAPEGDVAGWLATGVKERLAKLNGKARARQGNSVELPICYAPEFAPDLAEVAQRTGLAPEEVVRRHQQSEFLVYLIGFAPGFPYMGGLPAELSMPRRAEPRTRVPAGSVGVIGTQCCIYPIETPGGWNLIGRTPARLFRTEADPPVLLRAGDRVKFRAISREEFDHMKDES